MSAQGKEQFQTRSWKNSTGDKSVEARFVSRDATSLTLLRSDQQTVTMDITRLHQDDQNFLATEHPFPPKSTEAEAIGNAFGPLDFGDDRKTVEEKLLSCSLVKTKTNDALFGRTGLNGIFETTEKIGDLVCYLYFSWSETGGLSEVTLRTNPLPETVYSTLLHQTWVSLAELLSNLYGKPASHSSYPKQSELSDGALLASHLWRTGGGNSVLLGTGQEAEKYNVNVRFTSQRIEPVRTP